LDTGYLIALEAADDQHHQEALDHWNAVSESLPLLVTTSYVFDEVVTFFNSRNRHTKAVEVGNLLLESPSVKLVHIDQALFQETWRYFVRHKDKSYSLTDCASFIVMNRFRVRKAMTFDKHFIQAGFEKMPQQE
jgi:predicted nucleic acid-binding protein